MSELLTARDGREFISHIYECQQLYRAQNANSSLFDYHAMNVSDLAAALRAYLNEVDIPTLRIPISVVKSSYENGQSVLKLDVPTVDLATASPPPDEDFEECIARHVQNAKRYRSLAIFGEEGEDESYRGVYIYLLEDDTYAVYFSHISADLRNQFPPDATSDVPPLSGWAGPLDSNIDSISKYYFFAYAEQIERSVACTLAIRGSMTLSLLDRPYADDDIAKLTRYQNDHVKSKVSFYTQEDEEPVTLDELMSGLMVEGVDYTEESKTQLLTTLIHKFVRHVTIESKENSKVVVDFSKIFSHEENVYFWIIQD